MRRPPNTYFAAGILVCALTGSLQPGGDDARLLRSADLPGPAWHAAMPAAPTWTAERAVSRAAQAGAAATPGRFELVGHEPLMNRGMNAALAVHGDHAYIGSRTDGSHLNSGVLVVDVKDPKAPRIVHEIGAPEAANIGESSRELRILPEQGLLLVLNHGCSELIHRCVNTSQAGATLTASNIRFFDITGANAAAPKLVATYSPSRSGAQTPHEFFLWSDPQRPGRTLLYETAPSTDSSGRDNLYVVDLSRAREGVFPEIATWTTTIGNPERDNRLHSLTVSHDGTKGYLAYLGGGFLVADLSDFARAAPKPEVRLLTAVEDRVFWTDPGAHSAAQLPGRPFVMTTDEVYGELGGVLAGHGCPWGWPRFIDVRDPRKPKIVSEYKLPINDASKCAEISADRDNLSSFSSHNPTLTPNLALLTWHSAGLQAIDTSDPANPRAAGAYVPDPLPFVQTEDPALSSGPDKVVMWSFPIIKDGLIYVVDLRNGLYVLRYTGPHEQEVAGASFLDGNTNAGDVARFEREAGRTTAPAPRPSPGPTCLARPRRTATALGPLRLGATRRAAAMRSGPALVFRGTIGRACVIGGGRLVVVLRAGRVVLAASTAPGARSRRGVVTRGTAVTGRRFAGVTRLRGKALRSALRAAGLR